MFPCERDYHIQENQISERCKQIEEYLERCLMYPRYRDHPSMLKFLCISPISFLNGVSPSLIEDFLYKHSFQNFYYGHLRHLKKFFCSNFHILNQKRWFAVKDTYIAYLNSYLNSSLGFVILVDINFKFQAKIKPGAYFAIQLKNSQRSIILKFKRSENQKKWLQSIQKMVETTGQYFKNLDLLPHSSFAPVRQSQICKWYVNSNEYMEDLFKALDNAKEEIFIAGWWLCPEIYLKRPTYNKNHRLDSILIKKSKQNVKIYILLYKEIDLLLCLSSERVKKVLTQNYTNPNIKIILHPKNNAPNFSMWSHHEKIVVIDQSIAFFGGIDLCFGRWDDEEHRLVDVNDNIDNIDAKRYPFMSETMEHDIKGDKVMDLNEALSKIVRNSAITCKLAANVNNDSILKLEETIFTFNKINPKLEEMEKSRSDKIKKKFSRFKKILELKGGFNKIEALSNNFSDHDDELVKDPTVEIRFWMGKDYTNCYIEDFKNIHDFSTDQFDRNEVPRTPWRDQGAVTLGESARDLARHFIQRWNQAKIEMAEKNMDYPFLLPKGYHRPIEVETDFLGKKFSKCSIQILRSLDLWSGGLLNTESSILNAYCHLIENSDHYIYIEILFWFLYYYKYFVNNLIFKFFRENKKFRVYIVIPLLPGFDNFNTILAVQYFNLRSIKFGNFSIFNELENQGINPFNYITFHGMRNWSVLMGKLVQENVYVHSKLMIVDDRHVICGSANINDRSMLGKRDSEIAALIHDEEFIDSKLDNKNVKVGKYAYNLRSKIFK
ncbi:phospholipase D1 isoform X2 [Brachionus plicatilis]|uniref:phospholipase D n=1 Tax=Brachionus plicatilis TaxID=10195 RepID=A0A3M7QDE9_BRAPC|nr:phospholipase D1 isoform X2 [Brachionus plicatilis]